MERKNIAAIFARHGESEGQNDKAKGQLDYPLDEKGRKQAEQLSDTIAGLKPKVIFSSPLQRARIPAQLAAAKSGAKLIVSPKMLPWNFGKYEGQDKSKVEPILRDSWKNSPSKPLPGGESFNESLESESEALRPVRAAIQAGLRPAVIFHSRQLRQLPHFFEGKETADPTKGGPPPAGVLTMDTENKFKRIKRLSPWNA